MDCKSLLETAGFFVSRNPNAYQRDYRKKNPGKVRAIEQRSCVKHRATRLASYRKYNKANRVRLDLLTAAWRKANPEKVKAQKRTYYFKRRAKLKTSERDLKLIAKLLVVEQRKRFHHCYYCGEQFTGTFHLDHIQPLAKEGAHEIGNVCIACPQCNLEKGDRSVNALALNQPLLLNS